MSKLSREDKNIFFKNLETINRDYQKILKEKGFEVAENTKKRSIREYILKNKSKLLSIRDRFFSR